jgi:hypothetical protein
MVDLYARKLSEVQVRLCVPCSGTMALFGGREFGQSVLSFWTDAGAASAGMVKKKYLMALPSI